MSHWNNRVIKKFRPYNIKGMEGKGEWEFSIRETYYNEADEVTMHSKEARPATGESLKELKESLQRMLRCCDEEVLDEDKIVYGKPDFEEE